MRHRAYIAPIISLAGLALFGAGCGSVSSVIDVTDKQTLRPGEVLVLGRYTEIRNEDTVDFGEPHDWNFILIAHRDFSLLHLQNSDSMQIGVPLRNDGTFLWRLKPGEYRIIGKSYHVPEISFYDSWNPRWTFTLLPEDSAVYIGNIINASPDSMRVRDDYQTAIQTLKAKMPGMTSRPVARLMRETPLRKQ